MPGLRTRIEGAIKRCRADPDNLVRPWYLAVLSDLG